MPHAPYLPGKQKEAVRKREYRRRIEEEKKLGTNVLKMSGRCLPEKEIEKEIDIEIEKDNINYKDIVNCFNDTCVSFPKVKKLSNSRKKQSGQG